MGDRKRLEVFQRGGRVYCRSRYEGPLNMPADLLLGTIEARENASCNGRGSEVTLVGRLPREILGLTRVAGPADMRWGGGVWSVVVPADQLLAYASRGELGLTLAPS